MNTDKVSIWIIATIFTVVVIFMTYVTAKKPQVSQPESVSEAKYITPIDVRTWRYLRRDRIITHTTSGTADTPETITHYLSRIPQGFFVIDIDQAAHVYDFGTAWTNELIYLSCDVGTTTVKLIIF